MEHVEQEVHNEKVLPNLFCIAIFSKRIMLAYEMHTSCEGRMFPDYTKDVELIERITVPIFSSLHGIRSSADACPLRP